MRIDFYLVKDSAPKARLEFACRLIEKAYQRNHRIFIQCVNQSMTHELDELLWCYKDESFIPHNIQGEGPTSPPPVQLGYSLQKPTGFNDILVNLSNEVPPFYQHFKRIIEIVCEDDAVKEITRNHFRHYKKARCQIHTHEITSTIST
jgi:DNA polymerase III subunit chi